MLKMVNEFNGESLFKLNLILLIITSTVSKEIAWRYKTTVRLFGIVIYNKEKTELQNGTY